MVVEKFIKAIKRPRLVLSVLLERTAGWWSDRTYLKWHYRLSLGRKLNLDNPITFNEKLQWLKLYNRKPEYTIMVDKVKVKEYVAEKIGDKYIIPTIAVWDSADEIDWDVLPSQFVMKCSHDSGGIIICKDKSKLDKKKAISIMSKGLKRRYFKQNREWPYKDVTPRIIVEAYMVDESGYELKDYKFFCFDGVPRLVQIDFDRYTNHKRNVYDTEWNLLDLLIKFPKGHERVFVKPNNYEEMLYISRKLSEGIPHVRVDLYNVNGRIYFGEMTFFHGSGLEEFTPEELDERIGSWLKLPLLNHPFA